MASDPHNPQGPNLPATDKHAGESISVLGVGAFALGLVVLIVVAGLVAWGLFDGLAAQTTASQPPLSALQRRLRAQNPAKYVYQLPPTPRLQVNEPRDLKLFLQQEDAALNSYGWVDKKAGIVHIPIDEAMKLLVQEAKSGKVQP